MALGYCDVATMPDGTLAFCFGTATTVVASGRWNVTVRREWLDLRCGVLDRGAWAGAGQALVIAGKESDPDGGTVYTVVDGDGPFPCGQAFGTNSVCVGPDGVYILRNSTRVEVVDAYGRHNYWIDVPPTSQGIRDVTPAGELRMADAWMTRTLDGVTFHQPVQRGSVLVGQTDPPQIGGEGPEGLFTTIAGIAYEPHLTQLPDGYAVCARTPSGPELRWLPPFPPFVGTTPAPGPDPIPPPGGPMTFPPYADTILRKMYDKYRGLAHGSDDQRRELTRMICSTITFYHPPNDPISIGHKRQKGGAFSKDAAGAYQGAQLIIWDLFNGATREPNDKPIQSFNGDNATQESVVQPPIDYLEMAPDPGPGPDPEPEPDPVLEARVARLEAQVERLQATALAYGAPIALQTVDGRHYVSAEHGGGGEVSSRPTVVQAWETFTAVKP